MSSNGKPPNPRAFFISPDQSLGLGETPCQDSCRRTIKFISAVACVLTVKFTCATNLLRSALGNLALKFRHALSFAWSESLFASFGWESIHFNKFSIFYLLKKKIVVLTVLTNSNDHTVIFDEPIEKFEFIWLISCSFYNSWHNLKERGEIGIIDDQNTADVNVILPGNYTIKSIGKRLQDIFEKKGKKRHSETGR